MPVGYVSAFMAWWCKTSFMLCPSPFPTSLTANSSSSSAELSQLSFPECTVVSFFLCIYFSFLLFEQVFPYLFFLSPSGDLIILGGWASVLAPHKAFCSTYCQAQLTVLCATAAPYTYDAIIPFRYIAVIIFLYLII